MKKTIIELLLEWWARTSTTRMPIPTIYTYDVEVDGRIIQIESMSKSRMYIHYQARKKYPNAKYIREVKQTRQY
jgi:hypothetical protein